MILRVAALFAFLAAPVAAQDPTINYSESDGQMQAAISEARATLPLFLANAFDAEGNSIPGSVLKVELPTVAGSDTESEHIWVTPFARLPDGRFAGLLANEPVNLGSLHAGDRVDFDDDMISDWHLDSPSGRYWGSYTSRVMYEAGAFGDTPFDQIFEADPIPPQWH